MTVVGATQRAIQGGDPFDPVAMTVDATAGAFTKATKLGERMLGQAAAPVDMSAGKKPDVISNVQPPPGISKEEFIAGLEKNKKQKDSKTPIVETAIKNKKTGEVTKLGPKHPEDLKKELGLMPIDKKTLEEAVAPWSDLPQEQQDLIRRYAELTHETNASEKFSDPKTWTLEEKAAYERGDTTEFSRLRGYSKEDIAKYKEWQKTSDDVIKLLGEDEAFGIVYFLNQKHTYSHEAGFIDANGNFLTRKEAWNRATDTGQIAKDQKPTVMGEGLHSGDLRAAGDKRFEIGGTSNMRPVTLDDTTPPKYVYHGTKVEPQIDADGNLILMPSKNFEGKTSSVSLTHNEDFATDYSARIKGGGPEGFDFNGAKTIKIHSDALPDSVRRESGEEWAINTQDPVIIPKGKFEIIDHPLSKDATPESHKAEVDRLQNIVDQRGKGEYKEPDVEWNKPKETPSLTGEPPKEEPLVDRTKTSPRDIKDEQEFNEIAQEIYEKHGEVEAVKFFEGYQEYKKTWGDAVGEVEKFVGTNLNSKEANERIIHNNTSDLKEMAGKDVDLEKLSFDIDKGETLVGKAKEVANKFRQLMNDLGKRALEKGVINGWHEDYVARNVVTEGAAPPGALEQFLKDAFGYGEVASEGGTKTTTKYGEQRKLKTREDLTIHLNGINKWLADNGKDYRFKLKTDNLADIYKDYALSVEKAIENKNLIENIKQIRNENEESLIKPIAAGETLPYGWKTMDNAALAGYAIHQDLVPHLKFVFDSTPNDLMKAFGSISQFVKRMNVIGSFFHAKSLMEVQSSANIPIWSPIKESIVLPLVEKGVKAVTGKDIQLSAITKAVDEFRKGGVGTSVDKWIREDGLQLGVPEDVSQGILTATGKLADTLIGKFGPKTRILEKSLSTVEKYTLGYFDKYTWDYLHTGIKLSTAEAYLDKARIQASKEGKPFDEAVHRKEIAKFLNEATGGLNWYQAALDSRTEFGKRVALAAYSPEGRRALQIALFAPDWTVSTVRAFSSALPKDLNPTTWHPVEGIKGLAVPTTKGDYARLYQFKTALTYFTLLNAINMMVANRPIWENKDPTRIEWPDGTSMQAMKHAMEPYHWISDPDKTLSNKLGFIPKALVIGIAGTEYASINAPKLVDRSAVGRLEAVGKGMLPFQAQAADSAPKGEGVKRALLGTAGFPIYGADADTRKAQRAERELATKEQAWNYRDKEIKAGRMDWTPKHDTEKERLDKRREKLEQSK